MVETHIVKRRGQKEKFDEKKVYGSVYWACKSSSLHGKQCESISKSVLEELKKELKNKKEVNSTRIFKFVSKALKKLHKEAAYMYESHRDVS